jgi:predicted RecB family nuclease
MPITNELLSDLIQCRYRVYLKLAERTGQNPEREDLREQLLRDYCARAREHILRVYHNEKICTKCDSLSVVLTSRCALAVDVTATEGDMRVHFDALIAVPGATSASLPEYIPVIFAYEEKVRKHNKFQLALCASVLARQQTNEPSFGWVVHGTGFRSTKVQVGKLLEDVEKALQEIHAIGRAHNPPPLQLNAHCSTCVFGQRCRATAIEKDDLSLLGGIKAKESLKLRNKGIFTVTQLSYTFRPRKKSKRSNPKKVKYYHSLKALAIREKRIYVAGNPRLGMTGTPVYFDVEGIPDRDFYYLIGLRMPGAASSVQRSFWADDGSGEEKIWREFLQTISAIQNPQLLHYGSYETIFLRRMRRRYGDTNQDGLPVDRLTEGATNILSVIYGHIYFPTYSNSLKDIASYLRYRWSTDEPSGQRSLLLRHRWEIRRSTTVKQELITYNADDCEALELVVTTMLRLIPGENASSTTLLHPDPIHVDSLKPETPYKLGPVNFVLPELHYINKCAYWDYQRDRIYIRSNPSLRRAARRKELRIRQSLRVNKTFKPSIPWKCPRCDSRKIAKNGRHSKLLYDLRFAGGGVKRWISKYVIDHYVCNGCGTSFSSDEYDWTRHRYGLQLLAYVIYNIIELHIPQLKLSRSIRKLFGYRLGQPTINRLKGRATELYRETYDEIKKKLLNGKLIHADETHMSTKSLAGCVWVFTSMQEVVYLWSATREGDFARDFLSSFQGVLVSDFYSAYDSINCPQQRCLIHLIRDLNEDVLKEPFNEEMKELVHDFAGILKPIIETIDHFGLKSRFLKKHKRNVTRFYERVLTREYETEAAQKACERFRKNQARLFTFLDHDDVPWNNNNAEHAIKAFSGLRDVIQGLSNEHGINDYLMLLSICQTFEYRDLDYLSFLRSGEIRLDEYVRKGGR